MTPSPNIAYLASVLRQCEESRSRRRLSVGLAASLKSPFGDIANPPAVRQDIACSARSAGVGIHDPRSNHWEIMHY